jgi:hypothetical protein
MDGMDWCGEWMDGCIDEEWSIKNRPKNERIDRSLFVHPRSRLIIQVSFHRNLDGCSAHVTAGAGVDAAERERRAVIKRGARLVHSFQPSFSSRSSFFSFAFIAAACIRYVRTGSRGFGRSLPCSLFLQWHACPCPMRDLPRPRIGWCR